MSGKGDNPRPFSVTPEQFAANWPKDWNAREREAQATYLMCRCHTDDQRRLCADREKCFRAEAQ